MGRRTKASRMICVVRGARRPQATGYKQRSTRVSETAPAKRCWPMALRPLDARTYKDVQWHGVSPARARVSRERRSSKFTHLSMRVRGQPAASPQDELRVGRPPSIFVHMMQIPSRIRRGAVVLRDRMRACHR